jgi:transglutaminase-like putative cysteine protease
MEFRTSDVQDSAAIAFRSGEGVCQDHAHVFIASARAVGMPARYVSGYLYTGDTGGEKMQANVLVAESAHQQQ